MAEKGKTVGLLGQMDTSLVNSYRNAQAADVPMGIPKMDFMDMGKMSTLLENVRGMFDGGTVTTDVQEPEVDYSKMSLEELTDLREKHPNQKDKGTGAQIQNAINVLMNDPTVHDVDETTTGDGTATTTTTTTTGGRKKGQQIIKERRERVYGTSKKDFQREGRQLSVDFGDGGEVMTEAELRQMFNEDPQGHQHFKSYKKQFVTDKQTWHQFKRGKNLDAVDTGEKQGLIPRIKERKLDKKIDAVNPDMVEGWAYNYQTNQKRSADAKKMQQLLIDAGYPVGETGADGRWTEQSQTAYDQWKEDGGYQPGKVKKFFQEKATTIRDRKYDKFKKKNSK